MSLTSEGIERLWQVFAGEVDDSLAGTIVVSDGVQSATLELDESPVVNGSEVRFRATAGEDTANFDWQERHIVTEKGVVLDSSEEDFGRKTPGAIWTHEVVIDLQIATDS